MTSKNSGEGQDLYGEPPNREIFRPEGTEHSKCELSRKTWGAMSQGDIAAVNASCREVPGAVPHLAIADSQAAAKDVLVNPQASAQEKLRAVEALARSGVSQITLKDADGSERTCRLELEKAGKRTLVHLFAEDSEGRERVVLRGISNGDGTYSNERDRRGNDKSFNGDFWSSSMKDRTCLLGCEGTVPPPPGPVRPDRPDLVPPDQVRPPNELWPFPNADDLLGDQSRMRQYFDMVTSETARVGGRFQRLSTGAVFRHGHATIDSDGWRQGSRSIDPDYRPHTALRHPDGSSVDANDVPYMVLPAGQYSRLGIRKGDIGIVERNGRMVPVVFADVGGSSNNGEISMAAARELGINPNPRNGGVQDFNTRYLIFPGSGDGTPQTPEQIRQKAYALLARHAAAYQA